MKKFVYLFLGILSSLMLTCNVNALSNINDFSNLIISDTGQIYDNVSDTSSSSAGYRVDEGSYADGLNGMPYTFVQTTSNLKTVYNGNGASISQCGFNFKANNYYTITFYFMSDSILDIQYSPSYTKKTYKLGVSNSLSATTSFNPDSFESGVNNYVNKPYYVSWYTIIFKSPNDASCITSAFSTNQTYTHSIDYNMFQYLGYTYSFVGQGSMSPAEIQNALQNQFNSVTNNINSSISSSTNSINSNIDSMKDKQDQTNAKLDEQHETSKGIWGSLKDGIANIGKWFTNLGDSIGNFFKDLKDGIGNFFKDLTNSIVELFMGKEECSPEDVETQVLVPPKKLLSISDLKAGIHYNSSTGEKESLAHMSATPDLIPFNSDYLYFKLSGGTARKYLSVYLYDENKNFIGDLHINSTTFSEVSNDLGNFLKVPIVSTSSLEPIHSGYLVAETSKYVSYQVTDVYSSIESHYETTITQQEVCGRKGGLFGMITDLGKSIGKWFSDLTSSIGNFFKELLSGILEGLKSLFVPSDDQLYEIINDSKELTENFGFVGEAISFFITIFTSLLGLVNANGCIELPEFKIGSTSLFDEHVFWNSQNVCLADNTILSSNIDTIRTITSIVLVCMFINFAASKFFTILSKNDFANDTSGVDYQIEGNKVTQTKHWSQGQNRYTQRKRWKM